MKEFKLTICYEDGSRQEYSLADTLIWIPQVDRAKGIIDIEIERLT